MKDFSKENNLKTKSTTTFTQSNQLTLNVSLGQKRSIDSFSSPPTPTSTSAKKGRISKNIFDISKIESSSSAPPPRTQTLERAACAIDQYKSEDDEQKDQSKCQLFYGMKYDPIFVNQYVNLLRVERLGGDNYDTDVDWAFRSDDDDDDDNDSCYSYFSSDDEEDDYTKILCKNHHSRSRSIRFI